MKNILLANRLWKFSYALIVIIILWAIWIFGFVLYYYEDSISFLEGGVLLGLCGIMIFIRETVLKMFRKERDR